MCTAPHNNGAIPIRRRTREQHESDSEDEEDVIEDVERQARAGDWLCRPARTVQDAGGSDWSLRLAGVGDPPHSPTRAGDWHCRPAGRCKTQVTRIAVGDCELAANVAGFGDTPPSPALAGDRHCRPARPVQDAGDWDRGR